ncbi:ABC transporter ATP-binding protein [Algoriphagus sp.]|uniref:ABC transporter ATP-binding protein n=1 Tax=Algoriphagus sp. TaxID=1872435 RepID=UPI0025D3D3C8|nr:ABC transporter ATP-binding protein [Algoriphagus sp.]
MKKEAISGKNLSLGYLKGNIKKTILKDLNFSLQTGELTCLLGPNGVGKSTLVKAILGEVKPFIGTISVRGKEIKEYTNAELAKELAVVLTEPILPGNMTVAQLVALGRTPYTNWTGKLGNLDMEKVDQALSATKIAYLKEERLSEISDGQRQKAMIARALAQDGKIMILDEPTAHLDLVNRYEIMHLLRDICMNEEKAILVVTHDLEIALETADRFWLMNCGMPLVVGLPEDLIISGQINELLPGKEFHFDAEKGKIQKTKENSTWDISGDRILAYWLQKALSKKKITLSSKQIQITNNPFQIFFDGNKFNSLEDFLIFLETKKE